jgi:hypothetical protein
MRTTWGGPRLLYLFHIAWLASVLLLLVPMLKWGSLAFEWVLFLWVGSMRGEGHLLSFPHSAKRLWTGAFAFLSSLCKKTVEEVKSADFGGHLGRKPKNIRLAPNQAPNPSRPQAHHFPLSLFILLRQCNLQKFDLGP